MNELIAAYKAMWLNIFNFKGRTSVKNYWFAFLANLVISVVLSLIFGVVIGIFIVALIGDAQFFAGLIRVVALLPLSIYSLAVAIAMIAASVRRLHDAGFVGWMYLLSIVPIGQIALVVFLCMPSTDDTTYGPKEIENVTASPNNTDNQT